MLRHALNAAISLGPGAPQAHELLLPQNQPYMLRHALNAAISPGPGAPAVHELLLANDTQSEMSR